MEAKGNGPFEPPEKIKFTEEELTEMSMHSKRAKTRNVQDLFLDKVEERVNKDYMKRQKDQMKMPDFQFPEERSEERPEPRMQRKSKQTKRE